MRSGVRSSAKASRAAPTRIRPSARCCSCRRSISTPSASSPARSREPTVEGTDVEQWPIGQRVRVGDEAVFEITMVCDPCNRMDELREGLRAELQGKRGMLARIVEPARSPSATRSSCSSARAARPRRCLRRRRTGGGRTSRSSRRPGTQPARAARAIRRSRATRARARLAARRRGPRASASALQSQSARSKIPGSRSSQRPWVSAMSLALGAKTSNTADRPATAARGPRAAHAAESSSSSRCRNERNGHVTSATRSSTGGGRSSPSRRSAARSRPPARRAGGRPRASPARSRRRSHGAAAAVGTAIRPVPTASSTTVPRALCLLDVEADVLGDAGLHGS